MRILFMGTPDFAVPSLEALCAHGHTVAGVLTQPDRPKGRGMKAAFSPVKEAAPEPEPVPETIEEPEADEAEVVAAITAAVALMLDKPQTSFRVVSFRRTASK